MTAHELYKELDALGFDYDVVEIFEGARWLKFVVEEEETEDE